MSQKNPINRRSFIKTGFAGAFGAAVLKKPALKLRAKQNTKDEIKIKEYRTLGRTGFKASDISFGSAELSNPDVLVQALNMGMNYIDTAPNYGRGGADRTIGEVIGKFDRKKLFITTKLNLTFSRNRTKEGLKDQFYQSLERLKTNYADCVMLHMGLVDQVKDENFHAAAEELKADGKLRYIGVSNHGKQQSISGPTKDTMDDVVKAAAEDGRFDVVLFVYNFLLKEPGETILKICREKNIGTTLMKTNPHNKYNDYNDYVEERKKGGRNLPQAYIDRLKEYGKYALNTEEFKKKYNLTTNDQIRDAAMSFVLSHPDVHTVTISINTFDRLNAYTALSGTRLDNAGMGMLNDYESKLGRYYCRHACGICEPACPENVPVNTIMRYNHYFGAQGREKTAMLKYSKLPGATADKCRNCSGACEKACPYNVPAQWLLNMAHRNLSLG
ncbi:aldo/keto reductase [candidate division KSB1 bacterium]